MLSERMTQGLNKQIILEGYASHYYLSLASWCQTQGLEGAAVFFYAQSDEERTHMIKLFHYINEAGGYALSPGLEKPPHAYESISSIFHLALEQEIKVTKAIHELIDHCLEEKDYTTFNFLQWYLTEQHEEENLFRTILDKLKLTGKDAQGLFLLDKELARLAQQDAPGA